MDYNETITIEGRLYYKNQSFEPTPGYPDRCANCCEDFHDHHNGRCPVDDLDLED